MAMNLLVESAEVFKWILIGVILVAIVVMFVFSGKRNKQSQQEYIEQLQALKPGNKVKTAGGICGIVVEVCDEDNTIIMETGSEQSGKSYIKMDKELIAQTDAKGPTQIAREAAEAARKAEKEAAMAAKKAEKEAKLAAKNGEAAPAEKEAPAEEEAPASESETKE